MSKKSSRTSLPRSSTRSISSPKSTIEEDKYKFQSDDEDHQIKEKILRRTSLIKRARGRPPKSNSNRSSSLSSPSETEEKKRPIKRSYEKPVTRGTSRLSSTSEVVRDKIKINSTPPILITPKKRGRKPKMLTNPDDQQLKNESETNTNVSREQIPETKEEKEPFILQPSEADEFSDDSSELTWTGSSKMSIEILKRSLPKDESHFSNANLPIHSDPTARRKGATIPRLTNFDALSGKPINKDERVIKKLAPVKPLSEFDFPTNEKGARSNEDQNRPRVYAVKSTTLKSRFGASNYQSDIKRPKWMHDQQSKSEDDDQQRRLSMSNEDTPEYDYNNKGQYSPIRSNYRTRPAYPNRRPINTGIRGRPPGSRRNWNQDDDDDDYDQYEDNQTRYNVTRKPTNYRSSGLSFRFYSYKNSSCRLF